MGEGLEQSARSGSTRLREVQVVSSYTRHTPHKERLASIGLNNTSSCVHCGHLDTLQHTVVDCGERPVICHWTRVRIAAVLLKDPRWIPVERILRQDFQLWPPRRQAAVI